MNRSRHLFAVIIAISSFSSTVLAAPITSAEEPKSPTKYTATHNLFEECLNDPLYRLTLEKQYRVQKNAELESTQKQISKLLEEAKKLHTDNKALMAMQKLTTMLQRSPSQQDLEIFFDKSDGTILISSKTEKTAH